ncbi:unnamed protein product, partial [Musa textilis]
FHRLCVCTGAVLPPQAGRFHRLPHSDKAEWALFTPQLGSVVARLALTEFWQDFFLNPCS